MQDSEKGTGVVRCKLCAHYCIVQPSKRGICKVRENIEGTLYTLVYGSAISKGTNDPVEKKPLYHFFPGSTAFSIATIGCNFHCKHCQNWEISQSFPDETGEFAQCAEKDQRDFGLRPYPLTTLRPHDVISRAQKLGSTSIAYTYNEPTIWYEFIKETAILAKESGLQNILVTNGFSSPEANQEFIKFIDAANVDIKSFSDTFYQNIVGVKSVQPVLNTIKFFHEHGLHVEITNLIIPEENDNMDKIRDLVRWIAKNLGSDVPLHFSAYRPMYRLKNPSTSTSIIQGAKRVATEEGINFVFLGNLHSDEGSDTNCPHCGALVIKRSGYHIENQNLIEGNTCRKCGFTLPIRGSVSKPSRTLFF